MNDDYVAQSVVALRDLAIGRAVLALDESRGDRLPIGPDVQSRKFVEVLYAEIEQIAQSRRLSSSDYAELRELTDGLANTVENLRI